jgi:hypothetical protein
MTRRTGESFSLASGVQHRRVGGLPFEQPGEEATQRAEAILDGLAMKRAAPQRWSLGQPALVGFAMRPAEVGDALCGRVVFGDEAAGESRRSSRSIASINGSAASNRGAGNARGLRGAGIGGG